ncbi:MAG: hypothetical protein WCK88_03290 [bacterium]
MIRIYSLHFNNAHLVIAMIIVLFVQMAIMVVISLVILDGTR